jgi:hypothetical protein
MANKTIKSPPKRLTIKFNSTNLSVLGHHIGAIITQIQSGDYNNSNEPKYRYSYLCLQMQLQRLLTNLVTSELSRRINTPSESIIVKLSVADAAALCAALYSETGTTESTSVYYQNYVLQLRNVVTKFVNDLTI